MKNYEISAFKSRIQGGITTCFLRNESLFFFKAISVSYNEEQLSETGRKEKFLQLIKSQFLLLLTAIAMALITAAKNRNKR